MFKGLHLKKALLYETVSALKNLLKEIPLIIP